MKGKLEKHKKKIIVISIVVVVLAVAAVILFKFVFNKRDNSFFFNQEKTVSLEKMDLVKSISATGTIASKKSSNVSASLNNAKVKKIKVEVGDTVKKGQAIVEFDEEDLQETYNDALDNLADVKSQNSRSISKAKKQLNSAKSDYSDASSDSKTSVKKAKKSVNSAKKKVKSIKKKIKKNPKDASLTQQLEQAEQELSQAKSAYEQAVSESKNNKKQNKSTIENAEDAVEEAQNNYNKSVKEAQKQVDEAKDNLDACAVVSPITGTVTAINVEEGDSYTGSTLMTIEDTSKYTVETEVDEYDISDVKKGQKVVIKTEATDDDEIEGEITFVAPSKTTSSSSNGVEAGENNSSQSSSSGYQVKIDIKKKDKRLKLGMTAKCSIVLDEAKDVFAVPYDAVHTDSNGNSYVNVLDTSSGSSSDTANENSANGFSMPNNSSDSSNNNYSKITVKKGLESDYYVEISGDGLSEGLKVKVDTDKISSKTDSDSNDSSGFGGFPGGSGGSAPGGFPGGAQGNR